MLKSFIVFLALTIMPVIVFSKNVLLYCGKLITPASVETNMTVVISGAKIIEIRNGFLTATENDTVIDLKDKTVLPGLMDMHTHLSGQLSPESYSERFTMNLDDYAYRSVVYAGKTLMAGFTTVRELGGKISTSLRNAIAQGYVIGPRIFSAGESIATTGGHADPTNGMRFDLMGDPGPGDGVINSVDDARKAVRQRYKNGADLIKITATGGVLSVAKNSQNPQFTEEEIRAIVETARDYGMFVAAHAHGAEGMKRAIRAGVRSIEHGTLMDDEVIQLMKKHGTFYVPTVSASIFVAEKAKIDGYFPDIVRPKAVEIGPQIQKTLSKAYKAGVKIAFGTDSSVSPHGENGKEFEYMVQAGIPPLETIKSATMAAAELLGVENELGAIEKGKIADIIAVDGDPLTDITVMQKVTFVMKEGKIYKNLPS